MTIDFQLWKTWKTKTDLFLTRFRIKFVYFFCKKMLFDWPFAFLTPCTFVPRFQYVIYELQRSFNALFDNLFAEKQHLLDRLYAYNDRLRVIEVEFDLACKSEKTDVKNAARVQRRALIRIEWFWIFKIFSNSDFYFNVLKVNLIISNLS